MNIIDNKDMVLKIMTTHNMKVKPEYICEDYNLFIEWFDTSANYNEKYVEIPSNETLSGHAEIIDW